MTKTIYNVYVPMESQGQADRMKQLCIDNGLPIWDDSCAFQFQGNDNVFSVNIEPDDDFFILTDNTTLLGFIQATEQEFIELLKNR